MVIALVAAVVASVSALPRADTVYAVVMLLDLLLSVPLPVLPLVPLSVLLPMWPPVLSPLLSLALLPVALTMLMLLVAAPAV